MRHGISGRKLNRKTNHRIALLKNLSKSLIEHEQITTTLPKAKDLRPFVEKLLTIGKKKDLNSRRRLFSYLRDENLVKKIIETLSPRYSNRNGGYTKIFKSGFRTGDSAPMAVIELVERDIEAKGLADKERKAQQEEKTISQDNNQPQLKKTESVPNKKEKESGAETKK